MNDEQLILLYYGEIDDPEIARQVAADPQLRQRLAELSLQLEAIENMALPQPGRDYGARVWRQLKPQLPAPPVPAWRALLFAPRLSLASAAAVLLVAALAFTFGRQTAGTEAQLDPARLMASEVAVHLLQTDMLLTGLANGDATSPTGPWARQLLLPNRLYRTAAGRQDNTRLVQLLTEVETLLLQLANTPDSGDTDEQLRSYVNNQLLMRVRTMRAALSSSPNQA